MNIWRRAGVLAAATVLGAVAVVLPAAPSYATSGWVEIFNRGSGKCLTATGATSAIVQMACNGLSTQKWRMIGLPGSVLEFQNYWSGNCMAEDYPVNGSPVTQENCFAYPPDNGELWLLANVTNIPPAQVAMIQTYDDMCLDLENGQTRDGVPMQVWACNPSTNNQKWDIYPT